MADDNEATAWNGIMGGGACPDTSKDAAITLVAGAVIGTVVGGGAALLGVRRGQKEVEASFSQKRK